MKYHFHPSAEEELNSIVDYYEELKSGLGYEFAVEAYNGIQRIISYPLAWQSLDSDIRRIILYRFPFGILYTTKGDEIIIVAIMHLSRKPGFWKKRVR